jgi:hypothetical protein
MVHGQGWPADSQVLVYLLSGDLPGYALSSALVNADGTFITGFIFPVDPRWQSQETVQIVVQTQDGSLSAQASLSVYRVSIPATETGAAEPGVTPTETASTTPTEVAPTPTATPQPEPALLMSRANLNIRSGPGVNYEVIGLLAAGQSAEITGLSLDYGWWQIKFPAGPSGYGWVSAHYVTAQNSGSVPLVPAAFTPAPPTATATPTATSTPPAILDWRGEYYNNIGLSGAPVLVRNDVNVNFNWGKASPGANAPADNFSARWTRALYFDGGTYRFHVVVDDGARLWLDDWLVIDAWADGSARELVAEVGLGSGTHSLRLEYYERAGDAQAVLWWEKIYIPPTDDDDDNDNDNDDDEDYPDWKGEYWSNRHLDGSPKYTRNDRKIDFDWDDDAPRSGLPDDNFSVRWSRWVNFGSGRYLFHIRADDGIRIYIDGKRVLDEWHSSDGSQRYMVERDLVGPHWLVVEYYERTGDAMVRVSWERLGDIPTATPTPTQTPTATPNPETVALNAAVAHLAALTGLPSSEIHLVSLEAVVWPNTQLGCSPDGVVGAPVMTPGYRIILEAQGQQYEYHTDRNGRVVLCDS